MFSYLCAEHNIHLFAARLFPIRYFIMADRVNELVARLHDSANTTGTDTVETIVAQTRALFRRRDRSAGVGKFPKFTN